jgi:hypothetical protein
LSTEILAALLALPQHGSNTSGISAVMKNVVLKSGFLPVH